MSVAAHLSTSPPSVNKALATVVEAENTRASSHTQRLGLLSPIASFSSINSISPTPLPASSASSFSSETSSHHASRTPRTPLRSPKARQSPLFRLLQPFARALPVSNTDSHTMSQPPSPTISAGLSRSERLLRDALIKDDMERQTPALASSQASPSAGPSPVKSHRRRHSHIPTSAPTLSSSPERAERDEYTRGTFLFRTAMSNPRSPSPSRAPPTPPAPVYYGGDAEASPTTPVRAGRHRHSHSVAHAPQPPSRSNSPAAVASARSASQSPSPLRRRRPSPLPLDRAPHPASPSSGLRRQNTTGPEQAAQSPDRRARSRQGRMAPGEPLVMTPHEQVLRARLERVLSVGRGVEQGERERVARRAQHRSMSRENEVRDEDGGWPWRTRPETGDKADALAAGPLNSAVSNDSGTSSSSPSLPQLERKMTTPTTRMPSTTRAISHSRSRSKTEPALPPVLSSLGPGRSPVVPSPKRSSTEPSRIPKRKQSVPPSPFVSRTGTTPPLVAGGDVEEDDDGDVRLLTPPPTPPFTSRAFTLVGGTADGYLPSPYKTAYSPMKPLAPRPNTKASLAFGAPRRPRNAPVHRPQSTASDHEHEHEHEQDSSSFSSANSQASFPESNASSAAAYAQRQRRRSQSADVQDGALHPSIARHRDERPQFNARKASARCRAIEGYVSFASVEGLGEPPADPMAPASAEMELERGRSSGVLGAAWGGWKKLLNVAGLEGYPVKDGGVVL